MPNRLSQDARETRDMETQDRAKATHTNVETEPRPRHEKLSRDRLDTRRVSRESNTGDKAIERKTKKETLQWRSGYSPRPPMSFIEIKFCVIGGLRGIVPSFELCQNGLSSFVDVQVETCTIPLHWQLAYTAACTTILAVVL